MYDLYKSDGWTELENKGATLNVTKLKGTTSLRFLSLREVMSRTGIKKSAIYYKINPQHPRYDPDFPKRVKVGLTSRKFVESEVDAWMALQVQASRPVKQSGDLSDVNEKTGAATPASGTDKSRKAKDAVALEHVATLRELLEKNARTGKCISYKEAMAPIRLWADVVEDREIFETLLERVTRESHAANKGLLSVLIHERVGSAGRPSTSFFELAKQLGYSYEDKDAFVDHEIKRLYLQREDPNSSHRNRKLVWVQSRGKRMLSRL